MYCDKSGFSGTNGSGIWSLATVLCGTSSAPASPSVALASIGANTKTALINKRDIFLILIFINVVK
ncbi:MAG: hypothetical protein COV79_01620 [Parcubacteria group bacterium CG11_big_fil_rev_8_21_14_0_20_41_14]|nr:MAG: hypothetical protein COW93_00950 [Parcubacteria group bacterium CG22_combo_CG10-13_8_21_14_all_41_9]PIQ80224.1 MAG: hypothetical protein COV79_01620 [Parcubacteria group bacterium CG11_big_fil_rev_8_21_14_0_20_41_14]